MLADGISQLGTVYYLLSRVFSRQRFYDGCHQWNRNCLPFRSTWVHPGF